MRRTSATNAQSKWMKRRRSIIMAVSGLPPIFVDAHP
jgi:hypothetical protein